MYFSRAQRLHRWALATPPGLSGSCSRDKLRFILCDKMAIVYLRERADVCRPQPAQGIDRQYTRSAQRVSMVLLPENHQGHAAGKP